MMKNIKELKEIKFETDVVILNSNLVKGAILPKTVNELSRDVSIQGDTIVEGAIYANRLDIKNGGVDIGGAVFAKLEIHVNSDAKGSIVFNKSVGAVESIVSHARDAKLMLLSDVNAKEVRLTNAFIGGSIFADEILLDNCIVIGGVFATRNLDLKSSIVGTFNSPSVSIEGEVGILLPSAFSYEPIKYNKATTTLYNYSLTDLGSLYRGIPQMKNSGRVKMNLVADEIKSSLSSDEYQLTIRSYSIVGKVLAADLLDWDKMQNHFLLTAAALGPQLLKNYDLGLDSEGKIAEITPEKLYDFFFEILNGKISIANLDASFSIDSVVNNLK